VFANDTPNFIANRIGVAVMFTAAALMLEQGLTIEEVDALTGTAIGWPRTGTFRLADMVGIDILAHVAANFPQGSTAAWRSAGRDGEAGLAGRQSWAGLLQEERGRR
jgi:3-hydroxyacyl-CoA dehydrogenase